MKIRALLFLNVILNAFFMIAAGQNPKENWYTPGRNKLLNIQMSKDTIAFRKANYDAALTDYGYADMLFKVEKVVHGNYIVTDLKDSLPGYQILNLKLENGRNTLSLLSLNEKYPTMKAAENAIPELESFSLRIPFLDNTHVKYILQQKNLASMTSEDFKKWCQKIIEFDSIHASNDKFKLRQLFNESMSRLFLADAGFNSFVKGNIMDEMMQRFSADPETKELYEKMSPKGK